MPRPRLGTEPISGAEKSARRRARIKHMERALDAICEAPTLRQARNLAKEARAYRPALMQDTEASTTRSNETAKGA